jgi:hypothetical protein
MRAHGGKDHTDRDARAEQRGRIREHPPQHASHAADDSVFVLSSR